MILIIYADCCSEFWAARSYLGCCPLISTWCVDATCGLGGAADCTEGV